MSTRRALLAALLLLARGAFAGELLRVASLLPFASDAVRTVAPPGLLVASTRRSLHEPVASGLTDLGSPHAPDLEALASARADLVIADPLLQERIVPEPLRERVLWIDGATAESTLVSLEKLGVRIGAEAEMRERTQRARNQIRAAHISEPTSALLLFGTGADFRVITHRHWLGDLVGGLGAKLWEGAAPLPDNLPGIAPVNDELLAGARPDVVLLVAHGDPAAVSADFQRRLQSGGAWRRLRSAPKGAHVLDAARFAANPGLEMGTVARELARILSGGGEPASGARP